MIDWKVEDHGEVDRIHPIKEDLWRREWQISITHTRSGASITRCYPVDVVKLLGLKQDAIIENAKEEILSYLRVKEE